MSDLSPYFLYTIQGPIGTTYVQSHYSFETTDFKNVYGSNALAANTSTTISNGFTQVNGFTFSYFGSAVHCAGTNMLHVGDGYAELAPIAFPYTLSFWFSATSTTSGDLIQNESPTGGYLVQLSSGNVKASYVKCVLINDGGKHVSYILHCICLVLILSMLSVSANFVDLNKTAISRTYPVADLFHVCQSDVHIRIVAICDG